jgi:hypothetical protein
MSIKNLMAILILLYFLCFVIFPYMSGRTNAEQMFSAGSQMAVAEKTPAWVSWTWIDSFHLAFVIIVYYLISGWARQV